MSTRTQDAGIFTAYGFAREGGFEGTKEEFEAGLARTASVIPTTPTTDGQYNLIATVDDGDITYSWNQAVMYSELLNQTWGTN